MISKYTTRLLSLLFLSLLVSTLFAQREEEHEGDLPVERQPAYLRQQLFLHPRVDSKGGYNLGYCLRALEEENRLLDLRLQSQPEKVESTLNPEWTFLGPKPNIDLNFGTVSGRIKAIAVHPNGTTVFVGAAGGGVWRSTDGGANFTPLGDRFASLSMGAIAISPVNNTIVYAGTGELNAYAAAEGDIAGGGLYRSTDAGITWSFVGDSATGYSDIVLHPTNANLILAGTNMGVRRSTDGGVTFLTTLPGGTVHSLVMDPNNPLIMYAAVQTLGFFKSTDGGLTWSPHLNTSLDLPAGALIGRPELAMSKANSNTLYLSIFPILGLDPLNNVQGVYKSTDAGANWLKITTPPSDCGVAEYNQAWYDHFIAVDQTNASIVYLGLVDLFKSTDGGSSWVNVSQSYCSTKGVHPDQQAIAFDPTNPSTFWLSNDGGLMKTTNGGASFANQNTTLGCMQFYSIATSSTSATGIFGGTQDNGTQYLLGNMVFTRCVGGDGFQAYYDPVNSNHAYASIYFGNIYRTSNGVSGNWVAAKNMGLAATNGSVSPFFTHFVLDPTNANTLYWANSDIYKSTNQGDDWTKVSSGFVSSSGGYVEALAIAPNATTLYASIGTYCYQSINSGVDWTVTDTLPGIITSIVISSSNANLVYVTLGSSGNGVKNVYASSEGGKNFTSVSGDLPGYPCDAFFIHPDDPANTWFVGTDFGAYVTRNAGGTWTKLDNGLPNAAVYDFAYYAAEKKLRVGTFGRGIWEAEIALSPLPPLVTVLTPSGGERWRAGSTQPITWTSSHVNSVNLQLSTNSGSTFPTTVTTNQSSSGSATKNYSWTVPATETTHGRIRVIDVTVPSTGRDSSHGDFTIYVAAPVITSQPVRTAETGKMYSYTLTTYDSAGLSVTMSAPKLPSWATFTQSSKTVSGTPSVVGMDSVVVVATNSENKSSEQRFVITVTKNVSVTDNQLQLQDMIFYPIYPDPSSREATVSFALKHSALVTVHLIDIMGQEVAKVMNDQLEEGLHSVNIDVSDFSVGTYCCMLNVQGKTFMRLMNVVR